MSNVTPFHLTKQQGWAEDQARQHHEEALYAYGEYAMYFLMWHILDFERGLVGKCTECVLGAGRAAEAYGQGDKRKCPVCFGTTFEGGYRARLIRPSLFTDMNPDTTDEAPRGGVTADSVTIETTSDFTMHHGDYVVRYGNRRYQTEEKAIVVVRSGFDFPGAERSIAGAISSARLEDEKASVAYIIPPTDTDEINLILRGPDVTTAHLPPEMAAYEDIRGPLYV